MTPADIARVALRLADALSSIAAEAKREEPAACILRADYAAACELLEGLDVWAEGQIASWPAIGGRNGLSVTASAITGETHRAVDFDALADTWRTWGANLNAKIDAEVKSIAAAASAEYRATGTISEETEARFRKVANG